MTERKFTDEEVIKALDICGHFEACADCVLGDLGGIDKCIHTLMLNALDLINRQKRLLDLSEKGLKIGVNIAENWEQAYKNAKTEAIKDFAERLKALKIKPEFPWDDFTVTESAIDELVKEMIESKPCTEGVKS